MHNNLNLCMFCSHQGSKILLFHLWFLCFLRPFQLSVWDQHCHLCKTLTWVRRCAAASVCFKRLRTTFSSSALFSPCDYFSYSCNYLNVFSHWAANLLLEHLLLLLLFSSPFLSSSENHWVTIPPVLRLSKPVPHWGLFSLLSCKKQLILSFKLMFMCN